METVTIGTQTWCSKNLDVSTYRNGDAIPQVKDANACGNLTTGAWCYYENKTENGTTYGKLYNWYAVNDARGLAPKGFHIPSDAEWTTLTDYLGGEYVADIKMKGTSGWNYFEGKRIKGSNTRCFSGLTGGGRSSSGTFCDIGSFGSWWSSAEYKTYFAWGRYLGYGAGDLYSGDYGKRSGLSVRCVMD